MGDTPEILCGVCRDKPVSGKAHACISCLKDLSQEQLGKMSADVLSKIKNKPRVCLLCSNLTKGNRKFCKQCAEHGIKETIKSAALSATTGAPITHIVERLIG